MSRTHWGERVVVVTPSALVYQNSGFASEKRIPRFQSLIGESVILCGNIIGFGLARNWLCQ
jgi:hypothetical protein